MPAAFENIFTAARQRRPSALSFEMDGERYIRQFRSPERLILLGCGHISQALCGYAADLGFAVTAVDDRPDFANRLRFPEASEVICDAFPKALENLHITENDYVAILTRGHRYDADCLRQILPGVFPRYLGMIGSRRRVAGLFKLLEEEGFPKEALAQIHSPIGISIGALTVKEIAISILAELIACRRQNNRPSGNVLEMTDIDLPLLEFLTVDQEPKAVLIVCNTRGSTPARSGAMMAVDRNLRTAGTIGGGCGENTAMREAYHLIGTGGSRVITVDMSNDIAEEDGMVCGGQMDVLIADPAAFIAEGAHL